MAVRGYAEWRHTDHQRQLTVLGRIVQYHEARNYRETEAGWVWT